MFDKSTGHGNDLMMAQYVFLFLSHAILQETSMEMDIHTANVIVKKQINNKFPWSVLFIDHRNDVKMFKTLQGNH